MAKRGHWQPIIREVCSDVYEVQSESQPRDSYEVRLEPPTCTCAHFQFRQQECKHASARSQRIRGCNSIACSDYETESSGSSIQMTKEQSEFLNKLLEAAPRWAALARKARAIDCVILEKDLDQMAIWLASSVDLQQQAMSDDPLTRAAAESEAQLPFRLVK